MQPIVSLGVELQALGGRARLCVPPNFKEWVESYGLECIPIGPDLKKLTGGSVPGTPQVIIPHNYDQFYWAHRVQQLGVGMSGPLRDNLTVDGLAQALRECLQPEVAARAQEVAGRIELHGARIAAEQLTNEFA